LVVCLVMVFLLGC